MLYECHDFAYNYHFYITDILTVSILKYYYKVVFTASENCIRFNWLEDIYFKYIKLQIKKYMNIQWKS